MLLESGFISKACQASSRTPSLLPVASFAEACYSNTGGRSVTPLAGARLRSLRTWSKAPSAEGFLRTLQGGSRGISYGGLIKAFRGQLLQRLVFFLKLITCEDCLTRQGGNYRWTCQNSGMKSPVGWDFTPVMVWSTLLQVMIISISHIDKEV